MKVKKPNPSICTINNFSVSIDERTVVNNISFVLKAGTVTTIMGPNGSGKSSLAYALMGHPAYTVSADSSLSLGKEELLELPPEERSKKGLFLAVQSPIAVPGVTVMHLLRTAYQEHHRSPKEPRPTKKKVPSWNVPGLTITEFIAKVKRCAADLHIASELLERGIHDGFSGGERKKIEMLEALILEPKVAIFDEIDTGLDVDALRTVASGIRILKENGCALLLVTHYQRLLDLVPPDVVMVMHQGKIIQQGDKTLAHTIEQNGYTALVTN